MRNAYIILGLVLLLSAGAFITWNSLGELVPYPMSVSVPGGSEITIVFLKEGDLSGEIEYTCYNNNPGAQMEDTLTLGQESCCTSPTQPCYPRCTIAVTDTNNICRGTIDYSGNEDFEYIYYMIDGCWTGAIVANPNIIVSQCGLSFAGEPGPGPNQPVCGNQACEAGETSLNCPADCGSGSPGPQPQQPSQTFALIIAVIMIAASVLAAVYIIGRKK